MRKPVIHLICNAHLDPVWQWRWDEGAAEAITTFSIAARLLKEFPTFVFNHNEAILYRWVQTYDPALFKEIQKLVGEGRWLVLSGTIGGKPTALGIVNSGQHGFDLKDGEVRLTFRPYEIKTIRFERDGTWNEVAMIEEEAGKR
jgi:alpha-mannosidase